MYMYCTCTIYMYSIHVHVQVSTQLLPWHHTDSVTCYLLMRYILVYLYQGLQYITTHRYCIMCIYTCTYVHVYCIY